MIFRFTALSLALAAVASAGCGGPPPAPRQTIIDVSGKLTLGGKPVDRATMTFYPQDAANPEETPSGVEKGSYKASLRAGKYTVGVKSGGGMKIPPKYASKQSPLTIDTATENTKDFDLQ